MSRSPAWPHLRFSPIPISGHVGGSFGVAFSAFSNVAGVAVDDDGIYFQQVDLIQRTGANIVKVTNTGTNHIARGYERIP